MRQLLLVASVVIWSWCASARAGSQPATQSAPDGKGSATKDLINSLPPEPSASANTALSANAPAIDAVDWRSYLTGRWEIKTLQENMKTIDVTFEGDQYKIELYRVAAGTQPFLTIVGHYKATQVPASPDKASIVETPVDWSPKKICNETRCMTVPSPKPDSVVVEKVDEDTMQQEDGHVVHRLP